MLGLELGLALGLELELGSMAHSSGVLGLVLELELELGLEPELGREQLAQVWVQEERTMEREPHALGLGLGSMGRKLV